MTLQEKNAADLANSQKEAVGSFSNSFRSSTLVNLENGESFVIPENYQVFKRKIGDRTAEYINVTTNTGRTVEFYPTSMARIAFPVDENGKNIRENGRMKVVRSEGDVVSFIDGKAIDATMQAMKGCEILYKIKERVPTRAFGVAESDATKEDVTSTIIGSWNFDGSKRPVGYVAK